MKRSPRKGPAALARRRQRALRMLADGYEILRHVDGGRLPFAGAAEALLGKPGPPYRRLALLSRGTFILWREQRFIARVGRPSKAGWQLWRITRAGRAAAGRA